jgi:hypothetical protein
MLENYKKRSNTTMQHVNLLKIRETASKIKAKVGTLKLYGQLTEVEAASILRDADSIIREAI